MLAVNANKTIPHYLETGVYRPGESIQTVANAMDVGDPSNMERLKDLFKDFDTLKENISAFSVSDEEIRAEIRRTFKSFRYTLCPHTAAGQFVREHFFSDIDTVVVSTAHPAKFESVVEPEIGESVPVPVSLQKMLSKKSSVTSIEPDIKALFTT